MTEYHPDKSLARSGIEYGWCREKWDYLTERYDVKSKDGFKNALTHYMAVVDERHNKYNEESEKYKPALMKIKDKQKLIQAMKRTPMHDLIKLRLCMYQVITDYIIEEHDIPSYGRLITDPRYNVLAGMEFDQDTDFENATTESILRHALKVYSTCGQKMYFVSTALEHELRNTSVRGMPQEFFHLPYPCVYLVCPEKAPFKIFHHSTEWHEVEGIYLVEDEVIVPRTIRMILAGKLNDKSQHEADDALYHWSLYLKEGSTIEECIDASFDVGAGRVTQLRVLPEMDGHGERTFTSGGPHSGQGTDELFVKLQPHLKEAFNYAFNVMLYATHPDSEITQFNSSLLYENLRGRAMKAKGKKRDGLFKRAREVKGKDRVMLGGSLVIDRSGEVGETKGRGAGAKHKVRTYVAGHWQHYWTGEGRTERIYKRVRPYWKGPKDVPISRKAHRIGR